MTDVLALAEHRRGELRDVSFELLTAGRELADLVDGDLHVAVIGGDTDAFAAELDRDGVDAIHTAEDGAEFNHGVYLQAAEQLFAELDEPHVLAPHSVNGMDYAPAVATSIDRPLVTDVLDVDHDGTLAVTRERYGGKVQGTVAVDADSAVLTVRPAEWPAAEQPGDATIEPFDLAVDDERIGSTVTGFEDVTGGDVDISDAEFIVAVGRGIEDEENVELVENLAETLDATLAASRPIVDSGWLPANRQVGQSGKVVSPDVYLAVGISGAVQHVAGMKGSETIVAINDDPDAPIFDIADYAIVDDLFEVVPALAEQFE